MEKRKWAFETLKTNNNKNLFVDIKVALPSASSAHVCEAISVWNGSILGGTEKNETQLRLLLSMSQVPPLSELGAPFQIGQHCSAYEVCAWVSLWLQVWSVPSSSISHNLFAVTSGRRANEENMAPSLEGLTVQWWKQIPSRSLQRISVRKGKDGSAGWGQKGCLMQPGMGWGVLASASSLTRA